MTSVVASKPQNLSVELWEQIFEHVHATSPTTIDSLLFVNKRLHSIARRFKNRTLKLIFHDKDQLGGSGITRNNPFQTEDRELKTLSTHSEKSYAKIRVLLSDPSNIDVLQSIRTLTVSSRLGENWTEHGFSRNKRSAQEIDEKWRPVNELLAQISRLTELIFTGNEQLPLSMLETLERYHPNAELHLPAWCRANDDADHTDPAELALAIAPNLRSIKARFWNTNVDYDLRFPALKRIIALSPNLESVSITQGQSGCVVRSYSSEQIDEERRRGKLFEVETPSRNAVKKLICDNRSMVDRLSDVTNPNELEQLHCRTWVHYPIRWAKLTNNGGPWKFDKLKHFSTSADKDVEQFLLALEPLETLELSGGDYQSLSLSAILAHHGSSLRKLLLHEEESIDLENLRKGISMEHLDDMRRFCPHLEDITVDLSRSATSPPEQEVLRALALFPNLTRLGIHLDVGIADIRGYNPFSEEHQKGPNLAPSVVYEEKERCHIVLWAIVQGQRSRNNLPQLKELDVKVGEVGRRMGGGYPAHWLIWEASNCWHFIVRPSERDDRPDKTTVLTSRSPDPDEDRFSTRSIRRPRW